MKKSTKGIQGLSFSKRLLVWILGCQILLWITSFPLVFGGLAEVFQRGTQTDLGEKIERTWGAAKDLEALNHELRDNPQWRAVTTALGAVRSTSQSRQSLSQNIFVQALANFLGLAVVQILVFTLLAVWSAGSLSRQVRSFDAFLSRVRRGETNIRMSPQKGREFHHLGEELNRLLDGFEISQARLSEQGKLLGWRETARFLSHQIKNPLTSLGLAMNNLDRLGCFSQPLAEENAEVIRSETMRLTALVHRLKSLTDFGELKEEDLDLKTLVFNLIETSTGTGLEVSWEGPQTFPFKGDRFLLEQVFTNLFNNTHEVNPQDRASVRLIVRGRILLFTDSHRGLSPQTFGKLFVPPFTTKPGGTGLGLSFCRRILQLHGGDLSAELSPEGSLILNLSFPEADHA